MHGPHAYDGDLETMDVTSGFPNGAISIVLLRSVAVNAGNGAKCVLLRKSSITACTTGRSCKQRHIRLDVVKYPTSVANNGEK